MEVAVILAVLLVFVPILLLVGAVLLRAAVAAANAVVGDPTSPWDTHESSAAWPPRPPAGAIPEPGLGRGMLILLTATAVNLAAGFVAIMAAAFVIGFMTGVGVIADVSGPGAEGAAFLAGLALGFLLMAWVLAAALPTTFGRACLVTLFYHLISAAIVASLFGALFALGAALG